MLATFEAEILWKEEGGEVHSTSHLLEETTVSPPHTTVRSGEPLLHIDLYIIKANSSVTCWYPEHWELISVATYFC